MIAEYYCRECKQVTEYIQKYDDIQDICAACGKASCLDRIKYSAVNFQFIGPGFYVNDSKGRK
jgi:predicted nucleic acid-binding Zn ribbon protein